ncbi:hypothetical protein P7C71_g4731, partial [Lecanoromycetidae sp. Uapishka_2]
MGRPEGDGLDRSTRRPCLNDFFIVGEGIDREVLQREIDRFLGPEATARPSVYDVWMTQYFVDNGVAISDRLFRDWRVISSELSGLSLLYDLL